VNYWLMKTEPSTFSIDDLEKRGTEPWDGVRNYQARNHMMAMKKGDRAFIYHSSTELIGIAGVAEIVREAFPDPTAFEPESKYFDPKSSPEKPVWFMVEVGFLEKFPRIVTLQELKQTPGLESMTVTQRGVRLSVQPVTGTEWEIVNHLAQT
jgi:predicted RNA-binding protein with PUA-like domain